MSTNKTFYGYAPLFTVGNISQAIEYYCNVLGFTKPGIINQQSHPVLLRREDILIMLTESNDSNPVKTQKQCNVFFWVSNANQLFEEFKSKGAIIHNTVEEKPDGNIEFSIRDIDDHVLVFAQEIVNDNAYVSAPVYDESQVKFLYMSPVVASENVERDIEWYENKLGFKCVFDSSVYQEEGPLNYAVLKRQNRSLHMQYQFPEDMTSTDIRFEVKNIQALINEFLEKGLITLDRVRDETPWNTKEFGLFDLSGNRITFFEGI